MELATDPQSDPPSSLPQRLHQTQKLHGALEAKAQAPQAPQLRRLQHRGEGQALGALGGNLGAASCLEHQRSGSKKWMIIIDSQWMGVIDGYKGWLVHGYI